MGHEERRIETPCDGTVNQDLSTVIDPPFFRCNEAQQEHPACRGGAVFPTQVRRPVFRQVRRRHRLFRPRREKAPVSFTRVAA